MPTMQNVETIKESGARAGPRGKAPVFVLGCPRSGTTLLYHMLLSAGNFAVYRAESQVFNFLEPRFRNLGRPSNRRKLLAQWQDTELFRRTGLDRDEVSQEVIANCRNGGDFLRIVMEAMARHQGVERWADCTPEHLLYLHRIKQTIPDALIIHIVRDGRDVALSLEKQGWIHPFPWDRQKTLDAAALYWEWIVRKGRRDARDLGADYMEVRFEDLVTEPRRVLQNVSGFIGQELDYDKIVRVGIGSVNEPNTSFSSEGKAGVFAPVGRWRTSLTGKQQAAIEALVGETIAELGYSARREDNAGSPASRRWMRRIYETYFEIKLQLKNDLPFGKILVSQEMPRFERKQPQEKRIVRPTKIAPVKILQIGNYPPPMCGWAIQLKLVTEELRQRGHACEVLKINEGRQIKSSEYLDVQGSSDYLQKIWRYALRGYRLNVHVNGMSRKGYWLAMAAAITGRIVFRPSLVTFHGGLSQNYFPRHDKSMAYWAFYVLFTLAGGIACDSEPIQQEIEGYGVPPAKIETIATFSPQYLKFSSVALPQEVEDFFRKRGAVILSYVSFRPEYRLATLREGMKLYRGQYPNSGFVWLGFPDKEMQAASEFVKDWLVEERASLLLLGNLTHDQFLTLLSRCFLCLRTPACDGVAASVLESLALGVPVVASENGRRPDGVVTYRDADAADMCEKLLYVTTHYQEVKAALSSERAEDNVGRMADWLAGTVSASAVVDVQVAR